MTLAIPQLDRCFPAPMSTSVKYSTLKEDILSISSIWTHLARSAKFSRKSKMPAKYTVTEKDENGKDEVTVQEEGFLTANMINQITFEFTKPSDITAQLEKSNENGKNVAAPKDFDGKKTRTGLARCSIKYPNGETANKAVIPDTILQYRDSLKDPKKAKGYGDTYVDIGIPEFIMNKLISDARVAKIDLQPKGVPKVKNGYHWFSSNTTSISTNAITMLIPHTENGEEVTSPFPFTIRQLFELSEGNVKGTISFSINAVTTCDYNEKLDLTGARYHPTFKISNAYMEESTDVKGPELSEIAPQLQNEKFEATTNNIAKGDLLAKALAKLGIRNT